MTYTDVKRSAIAARLSSLVYEFGEDPYVDTTSDKVPYGFMNNQGTYYESENSVDAVYTVQINNDYCAVAFRGTTLRNWDWDIGDWLQDLHSNILLCPIEYNSNNNENRTTDDGSNSGNGNGNWNFCDIHRGYYEAFVHINGVETFLDSCHNNCPECDILLTGHSQGGSIAEVAGLYLKDRFSADNAIPYVITTGAPEALGAGCFDLFTEEERCHWFHYILTIEGPFGKGIVYDPFAMLYSQHLDGDIDANEEEQTYARYGGLAFVGHEIFISSNDPTSMLYGGFDDHRPVGMGAYGNIFTSHNDNVYADVLERQLDILFDHSYGNNDGECFIPTSGFSTGSICNLDDEYSTCANGLECKSNGWWMFGPPDSCQLINNNDDASSSNGIDNRFCHS
eukprot:CAMPEP_0170815164 /NCGR_PEP_ID=MMETSP0733-20121128/38260_1 /TAXON_ID=186038 /ORGANISM="Fragilariopsis kerguelensis, Strain L26-C5" /LENGTH=394 /DNA_ID=CAMNT_0011173599 /DNA_START=381 /DNA_END=1568 /DNA_ORIENTATION=-